MKQCTKCKKEKTFDFFYEDKTKSSGYSSYCKDCRKKRTKEYRLENLEEIKVKARVYSEKHNKERQENGFWEKYRKEHRDAINRDQRKWCKNNPEKNKARAAKRRARKLNATPSWADLKAIENFYKNCPEKHHVDHIVPLCGKNVCGLHVLDNLQYLPAKENLKKGNKF